MMYHLCYIVAMAVPEVGLGTGRVVYNEVQCMGSEERLSDCNRTEDVIIDCFSHEHDVGIICLDG